MQPTRPATTLTFAGIELDSISSEARLPQDKIVKCVESISAFLKRKKVQLKELQSLIGLLNFATSVVTPGKVFLRRLYDLTQGVTRPHHFIRLRSDVKDDLRVWLTFLPSFNGVYFFRHEEWNNSTKLNLFTDASGAIGFGAVFGTAWCHGRWPSNWLHRNIAILEFFPIVRSSVYVYGATKCGIILFYFLLTTKRWSMLLTSNLAVIKL